MHQHTQGQWSINHWEQPDSSIAIGAVGTPLIARIMLRDVSINEQRANALLMIAAPDMLEALEDMIASSWLSIDHAHNRTIEAVERRAKAIAAIDKAKGNINA